MNRELLIIGSLLKSERFGAEIRDELERVGESIPLGGLYVTLGRLEAKGVIVSRRAKAIPGYGGNRRRYYKITKLGKKSWAEMVEAIRLFGGQ